MVVELRGIVAVGVGRRQVEVELPAEGLPLSRVLPLLERREPRIRRYLPELRTILNGATVAAGADPVIAETDELMLLAAVAGGRALEA